MLRKVLLGGLLSTSLLFGSNAEININDNTLEAGVELSLNEVYELSEDANYFLTANYLSSEEETEEESSPNLIGVGLKMMSPYIDDYGFKFGLGIKGVVANNYTKDFLALPLNIFAVFYLNNKISFDVEAHYAPKVLTYADGKTYQEGRIKANYEVLENGNIFIGTRYIKTIYNDEAKLEYDDSIFFGYKVSF